MNYGDKELPPSTSVPSLPIASVPIPLAAIRANRHFAFANEAFASFFESSVEAYADRDIADSLPRDWSESIMALLTTGAPEDAVPRATTGPHGDESFTIRACPWTDDDGQPGTVVTIESGLPVSNDPHTSEPRDKTLLHLLDSLPALIAYCDPQYRYRFVNRSYEQFYDRPRAWFEGRTIAEVLDGPTFTKIRPRLDEAMRGRSQRFEFDRETGDVTRRLLCRYEPDVLPDGRVDGVFFLIEDVTAIRRMESRLHTAAWERQVVAEHVQVLVAHVDSELCCRWVNSRFGQWHGHPREFFVGRDVREFLGQDSAFAEERIRRACDGEYAYFEYSRHNARFDNPDRTLRVHLVPNTVAGAVGGFIALVEDITDEVASDQARRRNLRRLSDAQAAGDLGLWEIDFETGEVFWSDQLRRMLELDKSEFQPTPRSYVNFVHPDDRRLVRSAVEEAIAGKDRCETEHRVVTARGNALHVHSQATVERRDNGARPRLVGVARDITQRKQATLALRESEERFRWICETITDMVWLRYPGGERASFVSSGFGHIFKRPATDRHAIEGSWLPLVHPEDRDRVEALQKRTIEDSGYEVEYRIVRPDGDIRWVRERARPLSRGGIHAVAGLTADITAARNQREALRDYAAKLEQVQHVARAGFWEMDVASAKVFWSPQVNALLGVADHVELDGDQFLEFIHPEDRAALADEVEAALAGVREYDFEHRVLHSDGSVRHLHERARVDRDSDGRAVRMLGMAQDVTAWKHTEKRLADREAMLRQLIENTRDVFWLMDVDTRRVVYIGDGYAHAWGHQPRDDVPMPWFDDVYRYDRRRVRAAERRLIAEQRCDAEYRIKHPSGTLRWIRTRAFPVRDAAGNVVRVAGFSEETTEARAFAEMNRLRELAEAASQAKTEFVAQISHELRTPLNAILGFAQLIARGAESAQSPEQIENANEILRAGEHVTKVVDEMLDLSRIELGKLKLSLLPVNLNEALCDSAAMVRSAAAEKNIVFHLPDRNPGGDMLVRADPVRLRQIILNLLNNAIKFNVESGTVRVRIARARSNLVSLAVADSGPGFRPEDAERLFAPFERLGQDTDGTDGAGIGLALSRRLAQAMGGDLTASSSPGEGATFCLDLVPATAGDLLGGTK